jgi:hypothetical protein
MSNDLPPGQHDQPRTEQALRQKDSEQQQQSAADQIVSADCRGTERDAQCLGQQDPDRRTRHRPERHVERAANTICDDIAIPLTVPAEMNIWHWQ